MSLFWGVMLCHRTSNSWSFEDSRSFVTVGTISPATQRAVPEDWNLQQRRCENLKFRKISSLMNERLLYAKLFSFSWICMTVRRKLIYMFRAVGIKSQCISLNNTSLSITFLYGRWSCGTLLKRHKQTAKNGLFLVHLNWMLYHCFETKRRRLVMEWFWTVNRVGNTLDRDCDKFFVGVLSYNSV